MTDAILSLDGVGRSFFGVPALQDVTLRIGRGGVLGLVGQNGAGKSTLVNIVGGVVAADAGTMRLDDAPYAPASPREAERSGIAFIHQELNLFTNLSIAENIFIGRFPRGRGGLIDRAALAHRSAALLATVGLARPPDTLVERLSPGERQLVEVAKALQLDARLIIFDEPTTSLTSRETSRLFELIARLAAGGTTIVYISHILGDVQALADDIAVLRDGRLVATGPAPEFPVARMINLMLGRDIDQLYPPRTRASRDEVLFEARALTARGVVRGIDLRVSAGEVVGLFGLMGSGRTELARILFGLDPFDSGELVIGGNPAAGMTPRRAIAARMAFLTENRREEGLLMNVPVAGNIALASLARFGRTKLGIIDDARLAASAGEMAAALRIKSGPIGETPVKSLSGGNQQKVVIAKWLMAGPAIIILDEPTRGVDIAAKLEIYTMIDRLAADGCGILLISSEIEEAMAMCDRILVMSRGEIVGAFPHARFDQEAIMRTAFRAAGDAA